MLTALTGVKISRIPLPRFLRSKIFNTMYGEKYDPITPEELEQPLEDYRSINHLFTRGIPADQRPIADAGNGLVSPCDSTVQELGMLQDDQILTIKDIPYKVADLAATDDIDNLKNGHYAILFLSPRDCHRVFSPATATLNRITHVPGYRLLVHPPFQRKEYPVFTLNERIVMDLSTERGRCLVIMVAGWGVGHITHPFDVPFKHSSRRVTHAEFSPGKELAAGEWLATFELGSTVIMISEPGAGGDWRVSADDPLKYGELILGG